MKEKKSDSRLFPIEFQQSQHNTRPNNQSQFHTDASFDIFDSNQVFLAELNLFMPMSVQINPIHQVDQFDESDEHQQWND